MQISVKSFAAFDATLTALRMLDEHVDDLLAAYNRADMPTHIRDTLRSEIAVALTAMDDVFNTHMLEPTT